MEGGDGLPRSRAEAIDAGVKKYFTGKPCKWGHVSPRMVSNRRCCDCQKLAYDEWRGKKSDHLKEYRRRTYSENKHEIRARWSEWSAENHESLLASKRRRYSENREAALDYARRYRAENKDKVRASTDRWKENNPDHVRALWRKWYEENGKDRDREKRATPRGRLEMAMSRAVYSALRGLKGFRKWEELLGYDADALAAHLESQFSLGMTWDNYGCKGWHVDHIVPRSAFKYQSSEDDEFKQCWALSNLQPLWWRDNLSKGAKLDHPLGLARAELASSEVEGT